MNDTNRTTEFISLLPRDSHNERLGANVHPPDWVNPTPSERYNLVVIGAGTDTIEVSGKVLRFKKAVLATGARAQRPTIPGLTEAGFLTNETVFSLTELPSRLAVIGAGPIGCELAQTFARFGTQVYLLAN